MTTIRDPRNPRVQVELTTEVIDELVATARTGPAYSASYHVQSMADTIEALSNLLKQTKAARCFECENRQNNTNNWGQK